MLWGGAYLNRPIDKEKPVLSFDFTQPPEVWVHPKSLVASASVSFRWFVFEAAVDSAGEFSRVELFVRLVLGGLFLFVEDAEDFSESEVLLADDE